MASGEGRGADPAGAPGPRVYRDGERTVVDVSRWGEGRWEGGFRADLIVIEDPADGAPRAAAEIEYPAGRRR